MIFGVIKEYQYNFKKKSLVHMDREVTETQGLSYSVTRVIKVV